MFDGKLTHIQTAVKLRPPQSHRLKSRKQLTGIKYWSGRKTKQNKVISNISTKKDIYVYSSGTLIKTSGGKA